MDNRCWMYQRVIGGRLNEEFANGVEVFLDFAYSNRLFLDGEKVRCPCIKCRNLRFCERREVCMHLIRRGFVLNYSVWVSHGERHRPLDTRHEASSSSNANQYRTMILDAMGPTFENPTDEEEPVGDAAKFFKLLNDADEPLWDGCTTHTKLSAVAQILNIKSENGLSHIGYDRIISWALSLLPPGNRLKENYYEAKAMMKPLGLGYEKIHMCPHFCMLYYGDDLNDTSCKVCGHPRYKPSKRDRLVPYKILRYFPITPRLQRLYLSRKTASHMTWHKTHNTSDGDMVHPSDGEAWKNFNDLHPEFDEEARNVRLGLCSDGFNPFGMSAAPYSCWPVMTTVYNLPPGMCMKKEFIFLSMVIPGPHNPKQSIDVCLRPLIDELNRLWTDGVMAYDVSKKQNFNLKAALMWTINDFPAYGMLSGWSTHGKLSCPYCMGDTKSFTLRHGGKACFFDCHRRFLPSNHRFRRNVKDFTKDRRENDRAPEILSGEHLFSDVSNFGDIIFGSHAPKQKFPGFGVTHNWVKKSIFWELPYWKENKLRHNLDVMHIEKNVFDNIFNTVMDVKGKTKDNVKSRMDLPLHCDRQNLELINDGRRVIKPKATFTLKKGGDEIVLKWLQTLRFPDGYASNIGTCVNLVDRKLYGMKSHDCHVFMQRLIPVAFRELLPPEIWDAITEVSHFFRDICAHKLNIQHMEMLEKKIAETICKLERIFPPSFFDSMEHLPIHLPYEAKLGGPVYYRWMYPFERFLFHLKKKVRNKSQVEGSICEAYIIEEISNFTSYYFEHEVQTKRTQIPRNDDGGPSTVNNRPLIFCHPGRSMPKKEVQTRWLTDVEYDAVNKYVLNNCEEIQPWIQEHYQSIVSDNPLWTEDQIVSLHDKEFPSWLRSRLFHTRNSSTSLRNIAAGPSRRVKLYNGYHVNGFVFHTESYGAHKKTFNSGVVVKGSHCNEYDIDYYGKILEIMELSFVSAAEKLLVFKCHWYDTNRYKVHRHHGLVEVQRKFKLPGDDVFVFAQQCEQVYYTHSPSFTIKDNMNKIEWLSVIKTKARNRVELSGNDTIDEETIEETDDVFQIDAVVEPYQNVPILDIEDPNFRVEIDDDGNEIDDTDFNSLRRNEHIYSNDEVYCFDI